MIECDSFNQLIDLINAGKQDLKLSAIPLKEEDVKQLCNAISVNKNLKALDLYESNIKREYFQQLEKVVQADTRILYFFHDNVSMVLREELEKRRKPIMSLISKWNYTSNRNAFLTKDIFEFYINKNAIKCVSDHGIYYRIENLCTFENAINSEIYKISSIVLVILKQHLPIDLVKYTMCFWVQPQCNIKPIVSNIPALPKAQEREEAMMID